MKNQLVLSLMLCQSFQDLNAARENIVAASGSEMSEMYFGASMESVFSTRTLLSEYVLLGHAFFCILEEPTSHLRLLRNFLAKET